VEVKRKKTKNQVGIAIDEILDEFKDGEITHREAKERLVQLILDVVNPPPEPKQWHRP
jgi:hypothetical protein